MESWGIVIEAYLTVWSANSTGYILMKKCWMIFEIRRIIEHRIIHKIRYNKSDTFWYDQTIKIEALFIKCDWPWNALSAGRFRNYSEYLSLLQVFLKTVWNSFDCTLSSDPFSHQNIYSLVRMFRWSKRADKKRSLFWRWTVLLYMFPIKLETIFFCDKWSTLPRHYWKSRGLAAPTHHRQPGRHCGQAPGRRRLRRLDCLATSDDCTCSRGESHCESMPREPGMCDHNSQSKVLQHF